MNRLLSTAATVVITAAVTALVVVLTTASGGVGSAEAADEHANGAGLGAVQREQKAINRRIKVAILRANKANRDTAANTGAIAGISAAQGPQGSTGPAGPQGPPGAPGPPGLTGYEVVRGGTLAVPAGATFSSVADCPTGKRALGGGVDGDINATVGGNVSVVTSYPESETRWRVAVENGTALSRSVTVWVVCSTVAG